MINLKYVEAVKTIEKIRRLVDWSATWHSSAENDRQFHTCLMEILDATDVGTIGFEMEEK